MTSEVPALEVRGLVTRAAASGIPYSLFAEARSGVKRHVWVGSHDRDSLIRLDPDTGELVEYPLSGVGTQVRDIWPDGEGRLWFTQYGRNKVNSVEPIEGPGCSHPAACPSLGLSARTPWGGYVGDTEFLALMESI